MIHTKDFLRPSPSYPTYPPYHVGEYLEDYFYKRFVEESPSIEREYIAISWTTLYCQNQMDGIQEFLDSLDPSKKYFTVLQHDDAPKHRLPPNTLCFSAGGNVKGNNIIPIPLVCSSLPKTEKKEKKCLVSFVGSNTHPVRAAAVNALVAKPDTRVYMKNWSPAVNKSDLDMFIDWTSESKFALAPRGYGLNSFRLYEIFQLNAVPVVVSDDFYLPWSDRLYWSKFSVLINESDIPDTHKILSEITENKYEKMLNLGQKLYPNYFTLEGVYKNIIRRLKWKIHA